MVSRIRYGNAKPLLALLTLLAYLAMPGFGVGTIAPAFAQTGNDLERAREHYEFAEFDRALTILDALIAAGGQPPQTMRDAYVLQARCQVGLGNRNLAEEAFCSALAIDPDWAPDPVFFPRSEIEVFEAARPGCVAPTPEPAVAPAEATPAKAKTPWYKKPIVWVGAAAAVVLAAVALGGGGDDDDGGDPLPPPPDPPVNP